MMTSLSKIVIVGLMAATSITASVAAASFGNSSETAKSASKVTIIYKSDNYWPVKGLISVDPCNVSACVDA